MGNDCQFCGTSLQLPKCGGLIINRKTLSKDQVPRNLSVQHQDEEVLILNYQSLEELQSSLALLFSEQAPSYWVHIGNMATSRTFPISIQHLYERLTHPDLAGVIHNENFTSHLQPIVDVHSNELFGYESLLRTTEQKVHPGDLFSFAHRAGLQSMLDQKARRSAVKTKSQYVEAGKKMFINFLPSTIYIPEFCLKHTFQMVKEFNVDPADLVFEVVETEKITDVDHLKSILDTYKSSGMKVALDDVGSGYSTLEMLSLIRPDYLKIDRSYVQNCHIDLQNQEFLFKVMDRAGSLGIKVLAEGIETIEEWEWLKTLGIDYAQGYFIGRPQPLPETELILP